MIFRALIFTAATALLAAAFGLTAFVGQSIITAEWRSDGAVFGCGITVILTLILIKTITDIESGWFPWPTGLLAAEILGALTPWLATKPLGWATPMWGAYLAALLGWGLWGWMYIQRKKTAGS